MVLVCFGCGYGDDYGVMGFFDWSWLCCGKFGFGCVYVVGGVWWGGVCGGSGVVGVCIVWVIGCCVD